MRLDTIETPFVAYIRYFDNNFKCIDERRHISDLGTRVIMKYGNSTDLDMLSFSACFTIDDPSWILYNFISDQHIQIKLNGHYEIPGPQLRKCKAMFLQTNVIINASFPKKEEHQKHLLKIPARIGPMHTPEYYNMYLKFAIRAEKLIICSFSIDIPSAVYIRLLVQ